MSKSGLPMRSKRNNPAGDANVDRVGLQFVRASSLIFLRNFSCGDCRVVLVRIWIASLRSYCRKFLLALEKLVERLEFQSESLSGGSRGGIAVDFRQRQGTLAELLV